MNITNETLTAEVMTEIENLVKKAEEYKGGCMITAHRYAIRNGLVYNSNKLRLLPIEVTRYIHVYGSEIVTIQDVIDDCPMFYKKDIEKAGLTPVSPKDIAQYGKITKFVIDYENDRRIYNA
jgi:hypothetical protein